MPAICVGCCRWCGNCDDLAGSRGRIMAASRPVDFRNGLDGLAAMVQQALHENLFAGDIFVFRAKRAEQAT